MNTKTRKEQAGVPTGGIIKEVFLLNFLNKKFNGGNASVFLFLYNATNSAMAESVACGKNLFLVHNFAFYYYYDILNIPSHLF